MITKRTAKDLKVRCDVCGAITELYDFTDETEQITLYVCREDKQRLCKGYKQEINDEECKRRYAEIFGG